MAKTKKFLYKVFCGFFLGISVFAPGFSGSIVAIILGIYQDILRIASNPFKNLKQNIVYCIPIAIGVIASGLLFIVTFNFLFDKYEKATYLLFVGLVAGNLPVVSAAIKACGFKKRYLAGAAVAFTAAFVTGIIAVGPAFAQGQLHELTAGYPRLALSGFLGGLTALIPGMSVSMVLLLMGVYSQLIFAADSLLQLSFSYALPFILFCVCAVAGLVAASKVIRRVFDKYPGFANSLVFGFMAGSLLSLLIQSVMLQEAGFSWFVGGAALAVGLAVSFLFVALGKALK